MSDGPRYEDLLGRVFDQMRGSLREVLSPSDYNRARETFVFHMTDWARDFEALARVQGKPGTESVEGTTAVVNAFLYHAVAHLNAAARLLLDYPADTFATDELYDILARAENEAAGRERAGKTSR